MARVAGYEILDRLYEGPRSIVYRGRRDDGSTVVLKTSASELPTPSELARLRHEYELLDQVSGPGVVTAIGLESHGAGVVLVLEDDGGRDLHESMTLGGMALATFFPIAISLAETLGRVHAKGIVHRDIAPANVVHTPDATPVAVLIDFGISARLGHLGTGAGRSLRPEGRLHYISPEQTGRIDRFVDYRSDLYSLGATFYELLVGVPPFTTEDPLELIHCHLARTPVPPHERRPDLPEALSAIVLRLLAKRAEDRYRSAAGLRADLIACREAIEKGTTAAFAPGRHDPPSEFVIPQRAYGRDPEVARLLALFEEVSGGGKRLALLGGYSGVGKTTLIQELRRPVVARQGYFGAGKLDQLRRDGPNSALARAVGEVLGQALCEPDARLEAVRARLDDTLGPQAALLYPLIPELETLLGPLPALPVLGPTETQLRFEFAIRGLLEGLASADHPLVLFLDDLQWADASTLRLLQSWAVADDLKHLLLLGAYRDNEVDASHPLSVTLSELAEEGVEIALFELLPLPVEAIAALLSDTVDRDVGTVTPLAAIVWEKTGGNPFFVRLFLEELQRESLLLFDPDRGQWEWSVERIRGAAVTDNVGSLLATRLERTPEATQEALSLAATLGARFTLPRLATTSGESAEALQRALEPAFEERFIAVVGGTLSFHADPTQPLRFQHDRVQHAAYARIPLPERPTRHAVVGRRLLDALGGPEAALVSTEALFEVVDHFVIGQALLDTADERLQVARLCAEAGRRGIEATAYDGARRYLEAARDLLDGATAWRDHYDLTFRVHLDLVEVLYLLPDHEAMARVAEATLGHVDDPVDAARVHTIRLLLAVARHRFTEALDVGREALAGLGVSIALDPGKGAVVLGLVRTKFLLRRHQPETLLERSDMRGERELMAMRLLTLMGTPAYQGSPNVFPLLTFAMIGLTAEHGISRDSPFAFASYGLLLVGALDDIEGGYEWGQFALRLLERFPIGAEHGMVRMVEAVFLRHWKHSILTTTAPLLDAYKISMEAGIPETAAIACMSEAYALRFGGQPLDRVEAECERFAVELGRLNQAPHQKSLLQLIQVGHCLTGRSPDPLIAAGDVFDEVASLEDPGVQGDITFLAGLRFDHLYLAVHFDDAARAIDAADFVAANLDGFMAAPQLRDYHYWKGLAYAAAATDQSGAARRRSLRQVRRSRKKLAKWEAHGPDNHRDRRALLDAELARLSQRTEAAAAAYEEAILASREARNLANETLACRRAARFWRATGVERVATTYADAARNAAERWGASAVIARIDAEFRTGTVREPRASTSTLLSVSTTGATSPVSHDLLDAHGIVRAAQAVSGEVHLDRLVERVMGISLEMGGATRGLLLLDRAGELRVEAEAFPDRVVVASRALDGDELIDRAVINYVTRTKSSLLLDDVSRDGGPLGSAEALRERGVRALMCAPMLHQGKLSGVLYLENDLAAGTFSVERVELLETLSSQAAISIENAGLYTHLEEKIEARTRELDAARKEAQAAQERSEKLLRNILPATVADELKRTGVSKPVSFDSATVLFTDFVGFTHVAADLSPTELVDRLDLCFSRFDGIVRRHGLEKLKTIGDGYMCAAGIPVPSPTHALDAVLAGLEMCAFLADEKERLEARGEVGWEVRVGIHTGPLVAGVVGREKFAYDIWGDTVNTASRMESSGAPGRVNISGATHGLVSPFFEFEPRGLVEAKNRGQLEMFFVTGLREDLAKDASRLAGNERFASLRQALE